MQKEMLFIKTLAYLMLTFAHMMLDKEMPLNKLSRDSGLSKSW